MRFIHSVLILLLALSCALSQTEEVAGQKQDIEKLEIAKKQESELEQRISSLNAQKNQMEVEHKKRLSAQKAILKELKEEYEGIVKAVQSADTKATRRSKNIANLEKRVKKLQSECKSTIASSYLFRKLNHIVFDYVHPFVMEVLLFLEKGTLFITAQLSAMWEKIRAMEAYTKSVAFMKKYGALGWAKVKEYWAVLIQFINTTFHIDLYEMIQSGYTTVVNMIFGAKYPEVRKKVEGWWVAAKDAVKPSSLEDYIQTLRTVFQMTLTTSPYADLIFYLYIGIWSTTIVSLVLSCVYH